MRWWLPLFLTLLCVVALGAVPVPGAPEDSCADCPVADGGADNCPDGCPFCVCGSHRTPMNPTFVQPPAPPLHAAPQDAIADRAPSSPDPRDILHVPRLPSV